MNPADVTSFLNTKYQADVGPVELIGAGAWSQCYAFTLAGQDRVIRFAETRDDFDKDRFASRWHSADLPVPAVLAIGETSGGGYYAVSTRLWGTPLEDADADQWSALLPAVFALLDALRPIDTTSTSGYGTWDRAGNAAQCTWGEYLNTVTEDTPTQRTYGWRNKLAGDSAACEVFDAGCEALRETAARIGTVERHVIHSDLLNRNVLTSDGQITGVFDWGCGTYGDFLYDLAWLMFWAPWHPGLADTEIADRAADHFDRTGLPIPGFGERLQGCLLHIGLSHQAYNAHTGNRVALTETTERLTAFI